jgi:CDP-glucose 4,6-dehydratase
VDVTDGAFWRDRPVLVTGAAGFLGRHLTGLLREAGASVVALVRDRLPEPVGEPGGEGDVLAVRGDVRDQELLERVLGEHGVRTVFHLAAQAEVEVAGRNPVSTFETNVRGTWVLLEAVRRSPLVSEVVLASSDKAYGDQPLPYTEDMPLRPVHPYDVSKACADLLARSYHAVFGVPTVVTRCGNLFGPGDTTWSRLVPGTIRSLLRGERPVVRSDGTPLRDYLYVRDGAEAYLLLAEALAADRSLAGEAFNFASGRPRSVLEMVRLLAEAAGRPDLEPDVRGEARHEIACQHLSSAKAATRLGWRARTSVEEALPETVAWYRERLGGGGGS